MAQQLSNSSGETRNATNRKRHKRTSLEFDNFTVDGTNNREIEDVKEILAGKLKVLVTNIKLEKAIRKALKSNAEIIRQKNAIHDKVLAIEDYVLRNQINLNDLESDASYYELAKLYTDRNAIAMLLYQVLSQESSVIASNTHSNIANFTILEIIENKSLSMDIKKALV